MATRGRHQVVLKAADVPAERRPALHETIAAMNIPNTTPPARRALASDTFMVRLWDVTDHAASQSAVIALEAREAAKRAAALL